MLKTKDEKIDTGNIKVFADIIKAKRHCGLPVVGEYYPVHKESLSAEQLHSQVAVACRVMSEVGADAVKTFYTGKKFREIVAATPIPVLVLGADKMERKSMRCSSLMMQPTMVQGESFSEEMSSRQRTPPTS